MLRFPPKKILVPIDLSGVSLAAWRQAKQLAQRFGASIEAVYVEDLLPAGVWEFQRVKLDADLRGEILAHIRSKIGGKAKVRLLRGDPVVTILRLARTRRPDLIVLVAHRKSLLKDMVLGTTAERVLRHSPVPVLAVPTPTAPFSISRWKAAGREVLHAR